MPGRQGALRGRHASPIASESLPHKTDPPQSRPNTGESRFIRVLWFRPRLPYRPSHLTRTAHQGSDVEGADNGSSSRTMAPRQNGVVRLRAGFNPTTHEYRRSPCLLCTANVRNTPKEQDCIPTDPCPAATGISRARREVQYGSDMW